MRRRTFGLALVTVAIVGAGAVPMLAAGASARSRTGRDSSRATIRSRHAPPPYRAKHKTRAAAVSCWDGSYIGSVKWGVKIHELDYEPDGPAQHGTVDESSEINLTYRQVANAASGCGVGAFEVDYPTNCIASRGLPCPPKSGIGIGGAKETGSYTIDDTGWSETDPPVQSTLSCTGSGAATFTPDIDISASYVRAKDAYAITFDDLDAKQYQSFVDPSCPPSGDRGGDAYWFPTNEPAAVRGAFWVPRTVDVPATVFAHNTQIQISVSLPHAEAPDSHACASSNPSFESCTITASWSGALTLHRVETG
jgi:hypothetical protein